MRLPVACFRKLQMARPTKVFSIFILLLSENLRVLGLSNVERYKSGDNIEYELNEVFVDRIELGGPSFGTFFGTAVIGAGTLATLFAGGPLAVLGFTGAGIAKGSFGAYLMSFWGGATPAGGLVAYLQSMGATGTLSSSWTGLSTLFGIGSVAVAGQKGRHIEDGKNYKKWTSYESYVRGRYLDTRDIYFDR